MLGATGLRWDIWRVPVTAPGRTVKFIIPTGTLLATGTEFRGRSGINGSRVATVRE